MLGRSSPFRETYSHLINEQLILCEQGKGYWLLDRQLSLMGYPYAAIIAWACTPIDSGPLFHFFIAYQVLISMPHTGRGILFIFVYY